MCILKHSVEDMVRELGEKFGFRYKVQDFDVVVSCPFHKESTPSCYVKTEIYNPLAAKDVEVGTIHCFGCGQTGSFTSYATKIMGNDQGMRWLRERGWQEGKKIDRKHVLEHSTVGRKAPLDKDDWPPYYGRIEYMEDRGISYDIYSLFGCGYDDERKLVWFPVRNWSGELTSVQTRSTVVKSYSNDSRGKRGSSLYGEYELKQVGISSKDRLWVCESPIDALTAWEHGEKALALMGSSLSREQEQILRRLDIRTLVLALDQDSAGRLGASKIRDRLKDSYIIKRARFGAKDLNELHLEGMWDDIRIDVV